MNDHRHPRIDWHSLTPTHRHSLRNYYRWMRRAELLTVDEARREARTLAAEMIATRRYAIIGRCS